MGIGEVHAAVALLLLVSWQWVHVMGVEEEPTAGAVGPSGISMHQDSAPSF